MSGSVRGTIVKFALLSMALVAIFNVRNIVNNNIELGLSSAPIFIVATLLYFIGVIWGGPSTVLSLPVLPVQP